MCYACDMMRPLRPSEVRLGQQVIYVKHENDGPHCRLGAITSFENEGTFFVVRVKFEDDSKFKRRRKTTTFFGLEWAAPDKLGILESMVQEGV